MNVLPLAAIFVLGSPERSSNLKEIKAEPLKGAQMIMELVKHSFHLDVADRGRISNQFKAVGQVTNTGLPIYRITYPREHALLANVQDFVHNVVLGSFTGESKTS